MPAELRWTVLQLTTLLLLALATAALVQGMWFLLVLAVGASLTSTFYTHRYVDEHLGGRPVPAARRPHGLTAVCLDLPTDVPPEHLEGNTAPAGPG